MCLLKAIFGFHCLIGLLGLLMISCSTTDGMMVQHFVKPANIKANSPNVQENTTNLLVIAFRFVPDSTYVNYLINATVTNKTEASNRYAVGDKNPRNKKKARSRKKTPRQKKDPHKSLLTTNSIDEYNKVVYLLSVPRCFVFETTVSNASTNAIVLTFADFSLRYRNNQQSKNTSIHLPYPHYQAYLKAFPSYIFMSFPQTFFLKEQENIEIASQQTKKLYLIFPVLPLRIKTFALTFRKTIHQQRLVITQNYTNYAQRLSISQQNNTNKSLSKSLDNSIP